MIRELRQNDRETFLSLLKEFYSSPAVLHDIPFKNFEVTFDALINKSPFLQAFIFEYEGLVAGYALLSFSFSCEAGGIVVLIDELYIKEAFRGKGLGNAFFQTLEQRYPEAKRYRLEVVKGNKAIRLYERQGYKILNYIQLIKEV